MSSNYALIPLAFPPGKPDDVHALHKAGYAVTYDKFQFITVNGAGHMVSVATSLRPKYLKFFLAFNAFSFSLFEKDRTINYQLSDLSHKNSYYSTLIHVRCLLFCFC